MAQNYFYPPSGGGSSNASVGVNGAVAPTSSTEVGGIDTSGNLHPLQTDASGALIVSPLTSSSTVTVVQPNGALLHTTVDASALPTGASTSALQTTGNTSLASIVTNTSNIPTNGQKVSASSLPVVIASDQSSIPVTASGTVAVTQSTTPWVDNISQFGGSAVSLGSKVSASSIPVVIASDQGDVAVTVSNFPATQPISGTVTANQGTANATPWNENIAQFGGSSVSLGQKVSASSMPVVIASDDTVAISAASLPLPTGAATAANQTDVQSAPGTPQTTAVTIQGNSSGVAVPISAASLPLPTGAATSANQSTIITDLGTIATNQTSGGQKTQISTPTALTITQAAISVGTTAVRLTVSGSAPATDRVVLVATPDTASTATFYIGSSTVTNSGATRGIEIAAGQSFIANNDAGDYWIVASVASQTITVMEQS